MVQTGPKSQLGGVPGGLLRVEYQESMELAVTIPPSPPMKIMMKAERVFFAGNERSIA